LFCLEDYIDLLSLIRQSGFKCKFFLEEVLNNEKLVFMRHDIDFSLEDALKMALIEKKLEVKSTYFIMVSSNTYNPFSMKNMKIINKIISLGHELSLHFDPNCHDDVYTNLNKEIEIFEKAFKSKVKIISLHRPRQFLEYESKNISLNGYPHTYQDQFFGNMEYLSDSRGSDIKSMLNETKLSKLKKPLHLLIHPIWWTKKSTSPRERLISWLEENNKFLISETKRNCKVFDE